MSTTAIPTIELDPASGPPIDAIAIDAPASTVVGRTQDCDIVLDHASVSRRHALIQSRETGWYVTDQGSHNGVFVNSMRIDAHEPTALRDQDLFCITPWTFVVRISRGPEPPARETPAAVEPSVRPLLDGLTARFKETAFLAKLTGQEVRSVAMRVPDSESQSYVQPGRVMPVHAAASAKALRRGGALAVDVLTLARVMRPVA